MKLKFVFMVCYILQSVSSFAQPYYTWYKLSNIPTSNDILFVSPPNGNVFAAGKNGTILKKASNTSLWLLQNSTVSTDLNWYTNAGSSDLVCGNNGVILKSTNSGVNWIQANSGTTANLNVIQRFNTSTYGALGANGTYSLSTDAGVSWNIQSNFTNQTINFVFASGASYFVCGNGGIVFKTTNFGSSWINISVGSSVNLNSIYFSDINTGWVTGDNGYIAYTTNSGANWSQQISNTSNKLNCLSSVSSSTIYNVGNNGTVLKTTNSGALWFTDYFSLSNVNLNHVSFIGETGYAAGDSGKIFMRKTDTSFTYNSVLQFNTLASYFYDKLILNRNYAVNGLGLMWPKGSGKYLCNSLGLNIAAKVNGNIRTSAVFQKSEFAPGYTQNGNYVSDQRFKIYRITQTDSVNSYFWQNWGNMVPFGAPFEDVNLNGTYEPAIDRPGIKRAGETNFICASDAADTLHHLSNGYGAGTLPLGAEVHLTYWADDFVVDTAHLHITDYAIFMKYEIINKSNNVWTGTYFSFLNDGMIGDSTDDYIGSDSARKLAYYYNSDNTDGSGTGISYGSNPPAWGCNFYKGACLNSAPTVDLGMTSMGYFYGTTGCSSINMTSDELYNMARGFKKDGTPWMNILTNQPTKYNYTGDPQTGTGWTEYNGRVLNCGGSTTGSTEIPAVPGKRYIIFSTGSDNLTMNPGDKQVIVVMQSANQGINNKNAVTKMKTYVDSIITRYYIPNVSIGVQPISTVAPEKFNLYQNYPNPFNPATIIKFDLAKKDFVSLKIFDITGREIMNLVNENLNSGTYEIQFNGENLSSGIYFYQLNTSSFSETKKMSLIK